LDIVLTIDIKPKKMKTYSDTKQTAGINKVGVETPRQGDHKGNS
jgi:hypothetical protein